MYRKKQIEKCRTELKNQLENIGQNVKRAKSLPSNTSLLSNKSTTSSYKYTKDLDPALRDSGDRMRVKPPLSHHILRHLTTPYDSSE